MNLRSLVIAVVMGAAACSSTDEKKDTTPTGPPIAANDVGGPCSGVGTSPGDVATFEKPDCAAGVCIADARGGFENFDTYCSADCASRACPQGYACEDIKLGDVKRACLKSAK